MRSITYEIWNLQKIAEANRTQIELIERMIRILFTTERAEKAEGF